MKVMSKVSEDQKKRSPPKLQCVFGPKVSEDQKKKRRPSLKIQWDFAADVDGDPMH